ncbi:MAG: T9SS type A sorting domain-containing protein [Bacteroidetes bacterium]|nr:T9SS type A sorting domain-containing protein [Bacteroidota bacterium]MBK8364866.1 T9SS type A sorting domain-containing protein [Bacteroidota bacterium]MBK9414240.1 T9SS type A sorting domain-containing protein [Bacteroidota bacterium]MBL0030795.1 T9SS type A sorting domain-containing protein [Bacteroidota bacterium]
MKKILLAFALATNIATISNAQEHFCVTTEMNDRAKANDPGVIRQKQELENFIQQYATTERRNSGVVYVIPIVFHILHNYGAENISNAQILDQVNILNRDFRRLNADTANLVPAFQGLAADCEIEFRLPSIDPNGNCTNGIDRIHTMLTYRAGDPSKLNPWPNNKYFNVWVASSLEFAGAAAYAYYPGASSNVDGVLCLSSYIGSIGTSSVGRSRVMTHEIGHSLNLSHVWGDTNEPGVACGDDNVSDTPETKGWTSCTLNGSVCNPPIVENVQNYMEYSYCDVMFTEGQKTRMHATLNSSISGRNNLWTPANLLATGVSTSPQLCTPIADFQNNKKMVCPNGEVTYFDLSWNGSVSNRNWSFPGGIPSTSTDSMPMVTYPNPGTYSATLVVNNATGSDSITKQIITVSEPLVNNIPYTESFEDTASFPGVTGFIYNYDNGTTWTRVTNAGISGSASIRINNFSNTEGEIDEWVMPSMDFSNIVPPIEMTFYVANAQRNSTSNDQLQFLGSKDCGTTWMLRYNRSGANLATANSIVSSSFTPDSTQWRKETLALNPFKLNPDVRFKFINTSDRGNNTYIDNINITGTIVNVDEMDEIQLGFALYPNPTNESSTVQFKLSAKQNVILEVKNILGETLRSVINDNMEGGLHEIKLPALPKGIYMIDLYTGNKHHVRRLIVA